MSNQKLNGKVAVITGGSTGIGLATAQLFVQQGAYVFITGRRQDELDAAVKLIGREHVTAVRGDVSNLADLDHLYEVVKNEKGHIDVLFANAGVFAVSPLESITEEHYDKLFNINVKGLVFTVQKALPLLKDHASILLNASVASIKAYPGGSLYSATKAAVRSLARGWVVDLKQRQIRVNVISPGPIDTPIFGTTGATPEIIEQTKTSIRSQVPLGRMGTSEEIANVALFLASSDSSFITGIELFADGGLGQV
jgi:NAD(P)-dependent dehydrogenase (short-subunit alcohol dehydrogenase family)